MEPGAFDAYAALVERGVDGGGGVEGAGGLPHELRHCAASASIPGAPVRSSPLRWYSRTTTTPRDMTTLNDQTLAPGSMRHRKRLRHVRDAIFGEDASEVRTGNGLAGLRNLGMSLLRLTGHPSIAAAPGL